MLISNVLLTRIENKKRMSQLQPRIKIDQNRLQKVNFRFSPQTKVETEF